MTAVFCEKEQKDAFATRKRLLCFYLVALFVFLAAEAALITVNAVDLASTRSRRYEVPFTVLAIFISIIFGCGSLMFFSVKFRLTHRYCKMLRDMREGLRERCEGTFIALDPTVSEKDGVYFYSILLDCPPLRRGDITERKVLVERNHRLPDFRPGDRIKFVTHANIIMAYELIGSAGAEKTQGAGGTRNEPLKAEEPKGAAIADPEKNTEDETI